MFSIGEVRRFGEKSGLPADLALINANVRTMNPRIPVAEAVAIKKNRIILVGTDQEVAEVIGKKTKVISLKGKTVLPGLIDTHVHVADFGRCLLWLDLTSADSVRELKRLLSEKAKQTPAGKWIIGRGWNQNRFKEKRLLAASDLDEAAPDNPVILYHEAAMICAVNSKALNSAGVTGQTAAPPGGVIDKDSRTGQLTGILRDTATSLIWQVVPEPTADELSEATVLACRKIVEAGITSVHWILLSKDELSIIHRLQAEGEPRTRVNLIVPYEFLKEAISFQPTDNLMLNLGGVLITTDGYLDSKTAALAQPYSDEPSNSRTMLLTEQELAARVERVLSLGLQPVIHAMGDKAIDMALKVIESNAFTKDVRFRVEQAAVLNGELIKRLKAEKVVVSVQPTVIATEFAVWSAASHLGVERAKWLHPLKTLLREGVKVAGGSDCPMEPLNPMVGVREAVLRRSFPEQRLTVEEALYLYTVDAAYSSGEENVKGSIEDGKVADLTIFSNDPFTVQPEELGDISVETTIVAGKIVYVRH